ncbi:hypothetical protein BJX99DRAFT_108749 [Aspergillus californicus]
MRNLARHCAGYLQVNARSPRSFCLYSIALFSRYLFSVFCPYYPTSFCVVGAFKCQGLMMISIAVMWMWNGRLLSSPGCGSVLNLAFRLDLDFNNDVVEYNSCGSFLLPFSTSQLIRFTDF